MPAFRQLLTIFAVCALAFGGCTEKKIRKANVDEVTDGMAKKQVESILGQPTSETKDSQSRTTAYIYRQGKESVSIVFKDDKVQSKESTLSE